MKYELKYRWVKLVYWIGVINLYINLKIILLQTLMVIGMFGAFAFFSGEPLFILPSLIWIIMMTWTIIVQWRNVIKPNRLRILKEMELQEDYAFLFSRFTDTKY